MNSFYVVTKIWNPSTSSLVPLVLDPALVFARTVYTAFVVNRRIYCRVYRSLGAQYIYSYYKHNVGVSLKYLENLFS